MTSDPFGDTARVLALFERDDLTEPRALDDEDHEALRVALRVAAESFSTFSDMLKSGDLSARTGRTEHLCDSIRSALDCYATIKQSAAILSEIVIPPITGANLSTVLEFHNRQFLRLQDLDLGLDARMSLLLGLIQAEMVFFALFW